MFSRFAAIQWSSIRVKLVVGLLGITVPLIALLIYNYTYSVNVIHNQVAMSNKNMIAVNMKQLDDQLSEAERHMMGLTQTEMSLQAMNNRYATEDDYVMAKSGVSRRLDSDLIVYPYIDGFFVYSVPRRDLVDAFRYPMEYDELTGIRQAMEERIKQMGEQPQSMNAEWTVQPVNGTYYIVRLIRSGDIYIGAWLKAETMLKPLRAMHSGERDAVLIVNGAGEQLYSTRALAEDGLDFSKGFQNYYLSGKKKDYLVVGESSGKGDFSMVAVVPDKQILENLPYLAKASTIVILIAILMLPLSLWYLRKVLLLPLRKMMVAMRLIGEGNFNLQIKESPGPDEFQVVNRTFNRMISQIEELKINVYEEQLNKQRAELKHLQLQINPHFFMNALNILFNLAQVKRFDLIQEMTLCLVHYFRYMSQSNHPLVMLKDELQHVRNYLRIQQLRLPYRLSIDIRVPDYLLETPIPPLLLQTFVENTIKHAVQAEGMTALTIEAALDDLAEEPMVCITVRDTGKGFSGEALESIRQGKQLVDDKGEHFGLWNARERLRLQYGDQAWMDCYNDDPQGAVVEVVVPMRQGRDQKEGAGHVPAVNRG